MKFDEGHWRLLPGVEAVYPTTVVDTRLEADALVVTGYSRAIEGRTSYLEGVNFHARLTSPMPNVIRVQITHFKGQSKRLPVFDLDYSLTTANVALGQNQTHVWLKSGSLSVVAPKSGEWRIAYRRDDRSLTE